jgi:uncharacterized protein
MPKRPVSHRSSRPSPGRARSSKNAVSRGRRVILFLLGVLAAAGALYLACAQREETAQRNSQGKTASPAPRAEPKSRPRPPSERAPQDEPRTSEVLTTPSVVGVRIALVIDDLGRDLREIDALAALEIPITYAVLPFEEETPAVAAELERRGVEILCHLPMEPTNGEDPGPGALRASMGDAELRARAERAIDAVSGAVGVNNHMGSGLSTNPRAMRQVLDLLAERKLFFLDSRTSAQSVGYRLAGEMGIPTAERQVFLDGDPTPRAIRAQFERLLGLAAQRGSAIAIGHPHPGTLAALAEWVPAARAQGVEFVPVSYLLDRPTPNE